MGELAPWVEKLALSAVGSCCEGEIPLPSLLPSLLWAGGIDSPAVMRVEELAMLLTAATLRKAGPAPRLGSKAELALVAGVATEPVPRVGEVGKLAG